MGTKLFLQKDSKNKCSRNDRNRKSSLECHSGYCCRKIPLMDTKISGQNFKEKQDIKHDISIASKYDPTVFINYCGAC